MRHVTAALTAVLCLTACDKKADPAAAVEPAAVQAPVVEAPPAKTVLEVPAFTISTAKVDIDKGQELFATKGCIACHKVGGGKLVGQDLKGVTARRDETWVKKMILHPEVMVKEDETAKKLLAETMVPMPNQGVNPATELPFILAYLKSVEK